MKKGIHPEYNKVVFMDTTSGYESSVVQQNFK